MSNKCRVLIVDDSTVFRSQIRAALADVQEIEVVGFASNGKLALEVMQTKEVDAVTLDLEMPVMDGLQTLGEMKRLGMKQRVIVFSAQTTSGAKATMQALMAGASDFVAKPDGTQTGKTPAEAIKDVLYPKLKQFMKAQPVPTAAAPAPRVVTPLRPTEAQVFAKANWATFMPKAVVIASSTGGPVALERLFSQLRGPLNVPILIAQHMPPVFTASLAERLKVASGLDIREATNGEMLVPGRVLIAPGDFHMRLQPVGAAARVTLDREPQRNSVRPAADFLFESAASVLRQQCLGVVLTGMGADGRDGAVAVKQGGGAMIIQDRESCVVFGMPGAVFDAKAYDRMENTEGIAAMFAELGICKKVAPGTPTGATV